jgi:uncharacterized membrane protein HdeD (DUF308 family)
MKPWSLVVQGGLSIILGLLFLTNPLATSKALVLYLGVYWLILGILDIVGLTQDRTAWGWKLITGAIGIVAGFVIISGFLGNATTFDRVLTTVVVGLALATIIGIFAVVHGIILLVEAVNGAGWGAGAMGVLTLIFGFIVLGNRLMAAATLPLMIGFWLLAGGIALIFAAVRARSA